MDTKLLKYLCIREKTMASARAEELWKMALQITHEYTWWKKISIEEFAEAFHPFYQSSQAVQKLLQNSTNVYLLAVSIGSYIEDLAREFMKNKQPFNGYILDRMGSYLVKIEIEKLDRSISSEAKSLGYTSTKRFSPGYGDFPLEAPQVFVELIKSAIPWIKLAANGQIIPEKTVTALKGGQIQGIKIILQFKNLNSCKDLVCFLVLYQVKTIVASHIATG